MLPCRSMRTIVPYHPGFLLGSSIDMKTMKPGDVLIGKEVNPVIQKISYTSFKYSFDTSWIDVCKVFNFPPEYAFKVMAGIVKDEMVKKGLQEAAKEDSFTIFLTATFLQQKQFLDQNVVPIYSDDSKEQVDNGEKQVNTESLLAGATAESEMSVCDQSEPVTGSQSGESHSHRGTHWVNAVDIGNKLVIKLTLSCKDKDRLGNLWSKLYECLESCSGKLITTKMQKLHKLAVKLDKKLSKEHYGDVNLDIWYSCFTELDKYPASMTGMMKTLKNFMDRCVGWAEKSKQGSEFEVKECIMKCVHGTYKEEKTVAETETVLTFSTSSFTSSSGNGALDCPLKEPKEETAETHDNDSSSTVVDHSESESCYILRVQLQSFVKESDATGSFRNHVLVKLSKTTDNIYDKLFQLLIDCEDALDFLQDFLLNKRYVLESDCEKGKGFLHLVKSDQFVVFKIVADLDFLCIPMIPLDQSSEIKLFIKNMARKMSASKLPASKLFTTSKLQPSMLPTRKLTRKLPTHKLPTSLLPTRKLPTHKLPTSLLPTRKLPTSMLPTRKLPTSMLPTRRLPTSMLPTSKLPPGSDIDLLIFGKRGSGKSSTGNSILGKNKFATSAGIDNMSRCNVVGWTEFDNRLIKVTDTPGYDNHCDNEAASLNLSLTIRFIRKAIENCAKGFRASLLLVMCFGNRLTKEERKAILTLKLALGEDIIKTHGICVITHGDELEKEMGEKKINFEQWCKNRGGFLRRLFEECRFRCVLFNNKTQDPEIGKAQLIQLVLMVDSLQKRATRNSNILKYAQSERKKLDSQDNVWKANEEFMKDFQSNSENMRFIINDTNDEKQSSEELSNLMRTIENLNS